MSKLVARQPIILLNTHVYPRHSSDHVAPFMHDFAKLCSRFARVVVHCPHAPGLAMSEVIDGIEIRRFRYAKESKQTLAYRGDMHKQVLGSPFKFMLFLKFLRNWRKATRRLIDEINPDIVHAHWLIPGGYVTAKAKRNVPLMLSMHGTDVFLIRKRKFAQKIARKVFNKTSKCHFVSTALQDIIKESCKRNSDSSDLILPMVFGLEKFKSAGGEKSNNRILFVGRLLPVKGVDILLKALAMLDEDWTLDIVGDGPEMNTLEKLSQELHLNDRVTFHGAVQRDEITKFYSSADILVLPSQTTPTGEQEGLGVVLLEAMMSKVAVIGTNCGGIPEVIDNEKNGLLVEQGEVESLSSAISRLIGDSKLRAELIANAHNEVIANFSEDALTEQIRNWYGVD